jgi:ankyrin repeat protein
MVELHRVARCDSCKQLYADVVNADADASEPSHASLIEAASLGYIDTVERLLSIRKVHHDELAVRTLTATMCAENSPPEIGAGEGKGNGGSTEKCKGGGGDTIANGSKDTNTNTDTDTGTDTNIGTDTNTDVDVDVDARDSSGGTALWNAAANGHLPCVMALIKAKANTSIPLRVSSCTPLLVAAHAGSSRSSVIRLISRDCFLL